jgi:hypothetical protein
LENIDTYLSEKIYLTIKEDKIDPMTKGEKILEKINQNVNPNNRPISILLNGSDIAKYFENEFDLMITSDVKETLKKLKHNTDWEKKDLTDKFKKKTNKLIEKLNRTNPKHIILNEFDDKIINSVSKKQNYEIKLLMIDNYIENINNTKPKIDKADANKKDAEEKIIKANQEITKAEKSITSTKAEIDDMYNNYIQTFKLYDPPKINQQKLNEIKQSTVSKSKLTQNGGQTYDENMITHVINTHELVESFADTLIDNLRPREEEEKKENIIENVVNKNIWCKEYYDILFKILEKTDRIFCVVDNVIIKHMNFIAKTNEKKNNELMRINLQQITNLMEKKKENENETNSFDITNSEICFNVITMLCYYK